VVLRCAPSRAIPMLAVGTVFALAVSLATAEPAHAASSLVLDNDAAGPLIAAGELVPGPQPSQCVQISYQGATAGDRVGLFAAVSGSLADYLQVRIDEGTGGVYGDCSGFAGATIFSGTLATFGTTYGTSSTALTTATLSAGSGAVSYEFTFALADTNAAQNLSASAWFTSQPSPARR